MTTAHHRPGDTWVHPFGRAFVVQAVNVKVYHGHGHLMGVYAVLQAKSDPSVTIYTHMRDLLPQTQMEMAL